ncbi:MAG TPA: flagellar biosynthetic protein FliR [Candidatus Polarisedimenticolia bacterium]|nr:flagellar biosynthetic protein FliR [Candidatus Polarisedimenticolia bacterium]
MIEALTRIDLAGVAGHFALVLLRAGGLALFCPIFGSEILPARVRLAVALALTAAMLPIVPRPDAVPSGADAWIVVALRELSVGFGLGMAARALLAGIEAAAGLVAGQTGFNLAAMVDPLSGDQNQAPLVFQNLLATALFLAADLHHLFLRALRDSYDLVPLDLAPPHAAGMQSAVMLLGTRLLGVAVRLATPALVVTVAVDLVLVLVGRAVPQMQLFSVGYPVKMAAGIVAMAILVSATGAAIGWIGRAFASDAATLLAACAGS